MEAVSVLSLVFLAGLTMGGLSGSVIELAIGKRLSLREPFVTSANVSRSMVLVLLAGPFMMFNEALAALDERRIGRLAFTGVIWFCLLWLAAMGIFVLGLLAGVRDSLG